MAYNRGKLMKHRLMEHSQTLAQHLPTTLRMNEQNLWRLASQYGTVIVKPNGGYGGKGVMQVSLRAGGQVEIHYDKKVRAFTSKSEAYKFLKRKMGRATHLVQQKIALAKVDGRPFDIRVMVQRKRGSSDWAVTGKLAKIAGSGYIITNTARSRGKVVTLPTALRRSGLSSASIPHMEEQADSIALRAVRQLRRHYPLRTVGLDMGIDTNGKLWIIEANFKPMVSLFARLKDRTMYRRILSYDR